MPEKAEDGGESRLNFKIRNPTGIEVALTTITLKTLDKGQDDEGNPLKFVYSLCRGNTPRLYRR